MTKQELIQKTIANKSTNPNGLAYINLDENNNYRGWVADFGFKRKGAMQNICLDLNNEFDLFLLFLMASVWSRTGAFENAAFFIGSLVGINKIDDNLVDVATKVREHFDINEFEGRLVDECRKKVSVRADVLDSLKILIRNWKLIYNKLYAEKTSDQDWYEFAEFLHGIKGLGAMRKNGDGNAMLIKIPLVLRELRCQKIFDNIPGKYCCVPDARVKKALGDINGKGVNTGDLCAVLRASERIYQDYGDLYDIPLFAYQDVLNK